MWWRGRRPLFLTDDPFGVLVAIARGAARVVAVTAAVAAVAWLLAESAPGSAPERAARAAGLLPPADSPLSPELRRDILAATAERHDLQAPLHTRVGRYLVGLARLDFGRAWRDGADVRTYLMAPATRTAALVVPALLLAIAAGLGAAIAAARRPGAWLDRVLGALAAAALAAPPAWVALVALRALAAGEPLRIFPPGGLDSAAAFVLPAAVLALVPAFVIARHGRAALVTGARQPWAVAALARGASPARVVAVHALRVALPALAPLVTILAAYLLGASLVVERVFGIRGLGAALADAAARGDAPVVVGACVIAGAVLATVSVAVDLAGRALDPRDRDGESAAAAGGAR